jgi:serine/threonine-protein kinase
MVLRNAKSVGRYELLEDLGSGGFATVYRARDPVLDREIALKVLHPHLARDAATRDRFVREGRALARIRHPNIVQVFDAGEAEDLVYLAMELVDGHSVARLLRERGCFSLVETAEIVDEVASALAAVHSRGLVHCDVKPANILIERDSGRAVLLDLGVSRQIDETASASDGWLVGTPAYMAPEQIAAGRHVSPQTDVYQLGATAHAMLTGEPPFTGEPTKVMYAVVYHDPPDLAGLRPGLPAAVASLAAAAMAKEPSARPAGPVSFARQLRSLADISPPPDARPAERAHDTETEAVTRAMSVAAVSAPGRTAESPAGGSLAVTERMAPPRGPTARPAARTPRRGSTYAVLAGGALALLTLATIAGLLLMRGGSDASRGAAPAPPAPAAAVAPFTQTPSQEPSPAATPSPQPSARPTPTASPAPPPTAAPRANATPPPPAPAPAPAPAAPAAVDATGPLSGAMASRGYAPSGPVVNVPAGGSLVSVQRGDGADGQRLFIAVDGAYLGTDWVDASPMGVSNPRVVGQGQFSATYTNYDGQPPVTVTFTWNGSRLSPNAVAPGHCQPNTGC